MTDIILTFIRPRAFFAVLATVAIMWGAAVLWLGATP